MPVRPEFVSRVRARIFPSRGLAILVHASVFDVLPSGFYLAAPGSVPPCHATLECDQTLTYLLLLPERVGAPVYSSATIIPITSYLSSTLTVNFWRNWGGDMVNTVKMSSWEVTTPTTLNVSRQVFLYGLSN